ncbi:sulfurtransferase [Bordetella sp. BOR01]|uniref:sulfurtransferase n=1 Tax=Bordetella sp. BOR01 TaxID=2854779 RepID=UPI001C4771B2|nr:rhodanese-like domain-containing protein [Bordetella sp. BOR01]MBV7483419.1 hypothetical protein [Bordetella sp. BOR01]
MTQAHSAPPTSPFISAAALAGRLADTDPPALLFVSPEPTDPTVTIPASHVSDLASHYAGAGGGEKGRRPLPEPQSVRHWLAGLGIGEDDEIVVYDDTGGTSASRAWWVLRWIGRPRVHILDGGLAAWQARTATEAPQPAGAAPGGSFEEIDTPTLARDPSAFLLIDARGKAAFDGPGDGPSHLPGALNSPAAAWQDSEGRLLPRAERQALAQSLGLLDGDRPVVAYCGSGVAATYLIAATQDLGVKATLYAGSWSAWSADPARVATHR